MNRTRYFSEQSGARVEDQDHGQNEYNTSRSRNSTSRARYNRYRPSLQDRIGDRAEGPFINMQRLANDRIADNAEILFENHANRILSKLEEDPDLMKDNLESQKLRKETLKHMPQCLTVKRCIKSKLTKSVNRRPRGKPIGFLTRMKYRTSMKYLQMKAHIKNLASTFELWYDALKTIEGHFGSSASSYFKFLRWLFLMNISVTIITFVFIIIPQVTFRDLMEHLKSFEEFNVWDIFTGEGSMTNTILYYGYYSNQSVNFYGLTYSIPYAYFYTMLSIYVVSFLVLGYSLAVSYRKSFIETEGGLKNVFVHKIFCGWDYSIATKEAANLHSNAIYNELKELLSELHTKKDDYSWGQKMLKSLIHVMANIFILFMLTLVGFSLWFLLEMHKRSNIGPIPIAIVANFFNITLPILFTKIASYENYKNPRNDVGITLIRSFLLSFVIVGTLVAFWLMNSFSQECWETSLGQDMYRLILFDFLLSLLVQIVNVGVYLMNRFYRKVSCTYEFDVASNTLDLIYSQSLFWMGFYFSPLLSLIVTIKTYFCWYLKQYYLLKVCKPSAKVWRASQAQTWFLTLTFLTLLSTGGLMSFILLKIPPTSCGPFQGYNFFYEVVLANIDENHPIFPIRYLGWLIRPGVVALIIIALCARVYYVKERANAHREMVEMLRNMLAWDSKDKEFLLQSISKVTKGEWQYNIQDCRYEDPYMTAPNMDKSRHSTVGDTGTSTSTDNLPLSQTTVDS